MGILLSGASSILSIFLSLSMCHATDGLPDNESKDNTIFDDYRRFSGLRKLSESKIQPLNLEICEEISPRSNLAFLSETPNHRIRLPVFAAPLRKGDTIMVLEDSEGSRKMLVRKLKGLGFNVIDDIHGHQTYESACKAAEDGIKIPLFLFDFHVPFKSDEIAVRKSCGQPELNGGQTARLVKQIRFGDENPFENSIFVCLTGTPEDTRGYEDVFWQVRGKLTEPNVDQFFEDVRLQLTISELASAIVPAVIQHGTKRALSHSLKEEITLDIQDTEN